jgi:hypothetical protein
MEEGRRERERERASNATYAVCRHSGMKKKIIIN